MSLPIWFSPTIILSNRPRLTALSQLRFSLYARVILNQEILFEIPSLRDILELVRYFRLSLYTRTFSRLIPYPFWKNTNKRLERLIVKARRHHILFNEAFLLSFFFLSFISFLFVCCFFSSFFFFFHSYPRLSWAFSLIPCFRTALMRTRGLYALSTAKLLSMNLPSLS